MAKRVRAPYSRSKMAEIARGADGITSREVVDRLKDEFSDIIAKERDDLIDSGLMQYAGRLSVRKLEMNKQISFPGMEVISSLNEFTQVNVKLGENWQQMMKPTRNITQRDRAESESKPKAAKRPTSKPNPVNAILDEMARQERPLDETIGEFMNLD